MHSAVTSHLLISLVALLIGCSATKAPTDSIARVGKAYLTRDQATQLAGKPYDSLSTAEQRWLIEGWVERTLFELEGEQRGFNKDAELNTQISALKAELFGARLLAELPSSSPADSQIERYYKEHQQEFLRPSDAYLIELYWGETKADVENFRKQMALGDTSLLAEGTIASEGRWLAEHSELDDETARRLAALSDGQLTEPLPYDDGYRVMKLEETYPAGAVLALEAVREEIAGRLLLEASKARQETLLTELRSRWTVELFDK